MRSDSDLQDDIRVEVVRQFSDGAHAIDIQVLDGVVTLTGRVGGDLEKWRLDDAVRAMTGVRGLIDETMTVAQPEPASPNPDTARTWFPAG